MKREQLENSLEPYKELIKVLDADLRSLASSTENSPIIYMSSRIKSVDSILNKLLKKELAIYELKKLNDIVGIRMVVRFLDDIDFVCNLIRNSGFSIAEERNYITGIKKESGYRAYHFIIEKDGLLAEIQVRTFIMDTWSDLEHNLRYKANLSYCEEASLILSQTAPIPHALDEVYNSLYKAALLYHDDNGSTDVLNVLKGEMPFSMILDQVNGLYMLMIRGMTHMGEDILE